MPSTPSPVAVGAVAKVALPVGLTLMTGYSENVASVPPPGSASPTAAILDMPDAPVMNAAIGVGPASTDATNPTAPAALTAGHGPKWENVPPPGALSPVAATARMRPLSIENTAAAADAFLRPAWNATTPASLRATRSENLVKMPPTGVSSPAPTSIVILPASARNRPPGTPRPSTTAMKTSAPRLLSDGGPKPENTPPAGAASPCETTLPILPAARW